MSAAYAVVQYLFITFMYSVEKGKHILLLFSSSGRPTILVFLYQKNMAFRMSDFRFVEHSLLWSAGMERSADECSEFHDAVYIQSRSENSLVHLTVLEAAMTVVDCTAPLNRYTCYGAIEVVAIIIIGNFIPWERTFQELSFL